MKKLVIISICILLTSNANFCLGQSKKEIAKTTKGTAEEMTSEYFKEIVNIVLTRGDRQTYCNMYNDNPHYKIEDFEIYLNPVSQRTNPLSTKISDYDVIVIHDQKATEQYHSIKLVDNKVLFDTAPVTSYLIKIDHELHKEANDAMTSDYFKKIVTFVLSKGDRQSYGLTYKNNPHYKIENFDVYLNPKNHRTSFYEEDHSTKTADYDGIVIRDRNAKEQFHYIKLVNNEVFFDTDRLKNYLIKIDNELNQKD